MSTYSIEEAQVKLSQLIDLAGQGQEVLITRDQQPVAKLIGQKPGEGIPRVPGNCKGMITLAIEDEEHLKDFEEYLS